MNENSVVIVQKRNDENRMIEIKEGETVLGRGKYLEISDKKVSRTHACLKLKNSELTLKSTHVNPCFLNLKHRNKKILLKQGGSINLEDEDEFSLLQDKHHFQVKYTADIKQTEWTSNLKDKEACDFIAKIDSSVETSSVNVSSCSSTDSRDEKFAKITSTESCTASKSKELCKIQNTCANPFSKSSNIASVAKRKRKLPSWMLNKDKDPQIQEQTSHSSAKSRRRLPPNNDPAQDLQRNEAVTAEVTLSQNSPNGASISSMPDGNKTATLTTKSNVSETEKDNSPYKSCSSTKRETCAYGKSCFRKNPVHFQEYSHPGDNDYISESSDDDKPECEFGLQCYRKNPLHKKMFKHTRRATPKRSAATKKSRDSDEYDDSFIDDDEEDLSEESDWEPSPKKNDDSTSESDENINDLLDAAKKFTKNKILWKK